MRIKVFIQPNSKKNEVVGLHGDAIKIKIKAPPVDGEANDTLIKFLSECLDLPQKNISILHGQTGKNKLVEILSELSDDEVRNTLLSANKVS